MLELACTKVCPTCKCGPFCSNCGQMIWKTAPLGTVAPQPSQAGKTWRHLHESGISYPSHILCWTKMPVRIHHLPKKPLMYCSWPILRKIVWEIIGPVAGVSKNQGCHMFEPPCMMPSFLSGILPVRTYAISAARPKPDVRKLEAPQGLLAKGAWYYW